MVRWAKIALANILNRLSNLLIHVACKCQQWSEDPARLICFISAVHYRSLPWTLAFAFLWLTINEINSCFNARRACENIANIIISLKNLQGNIITEIGSQEFFQHFDALLFSNYHLLRTWNNRFKESLGLNDLFHKNPIRIFINHSAATESPTAFVNNFGPSIVILGQHPNALRGRYKLDLYHEVGHASPSGMHQWSRGNSRIIALLIASLLLISTASSAWLYIPIALFITFELCKQRSVATFREVYADNFAVHSFVDPEERMEAINDAQYLFVERLNRIEKNIKAQYGFQGGRLKRVFASKVIALDAF